MKKSVLMVTIFLILFAPGRAAAQLKLFVGGAVTEPVKRVDAEFAKKSGHRSDLTSDTSGALQNKLRSGEKADVIIIAATAMDALEKENRIVPGTRVDIARGLIGRLDVEHDAVGRRAWSGRDLDGLEVVKVL